jgi:hypothetical protein
MDCIGVIHDKGPLRFHIITLQTSLPCKQQATLTDQFQTVISETSFRLRPAGTLGNERRISMLFLS